MKSDVKVAIVKSVPVLKNLTMTSGVRDKDSAETWGRKNGYGVVYFLPRLQRVYADRMATVERKTLEIEKRSEQLRLFAEGQ